MHVRQARAAVSSEAGDLGRRNFERQNELSLTIDEVAERAGIAADYLEYLERTPTAEPSSSTPVRIALALEMSTSDLLGGQHGQA
jgi:transcriptional regulator with XRE-family HTH domain